MPRIDHSTVRMLATMILVVSAGVLAIFGASKAQAFALSATEYTAGSAAEPAAASAATAPAEDDAAGAHGGKKNDKADVLPGINQGLVNSLAALVVFAIVFAILYVKVWPVINKGLEERENKIRTEIEQAEMAQQQAKMALAQYEENLAEARAEAKKMLDETKQRQTQLAAELKAKADAELSEMRDRARRDIENAKRAAVNEIYAQASQLATIAAAKILQREIGPEDNKRLIDESLAEMGENMDSSTAVASAN